MSAFPRAAGAAFDRRRRASRKAGFFRLIALEAPGAVPPGRHWSGTMKRVATWAFYAIGALAIAYLALYAYAMFTSSPIVPGDPIQIFRKPDAPSYS
jgi:hypothetical protein